MSASDEEGVNTPPEIINAAEEVRRTQILETLRSPRKLVAHIGMLFTHVIGILKMGILYFRWGKIENVMDKFHAIEYYCNKFDSCDPALIMWREKKITSIVAFGTFILYTFVGIFAHISSVSSLDEDVKTLYFSDDQSCYDYLRYHFLIPFPTETKEGCYWAITFMDVGLGIFAWIIACYDGLFVGLVGCLKVHLTILAYVFKTSGRLVVVHKDDLKNSSASVDQKLNKYLTRNIKYYQKLLEIRDDIESITSLAILGQALASIFVLSSTLYAASTVPLVSPEFFAQLEYLLCLLVQLFLLCFYGNGISSACDKMRISLYECNWYSQSESFKFQMKMSLMRLQKPLVLTMGRFAPLNLAVFLTVCKGSFSYFTLFKSLKS